MTVRKGTYALFVEFGRDRRITVGALGPHLFREGAYCYVGSAMGGLDQRISRHLAHSKNARWHIDHLTTRCDRAEAWESYPDFVPECELARIAGECGMEPELDGFGCSDCRCQTHLFKAVPAARERLVSRCSLHLWGTA